MREALAAAASRRRNRPLPTTVSDMDQVCGWLERHCDPEQVAAALKAVEEAKKPPASQLEQQLSLWKKRAVNRVKSGREHEGGEPAPAEVETGSAGQPAAGRWLAELRREVESDATPEGVKASVWEKQAKLEQDWHADIQRRKREASQLRGRRWGTGPTSGRRDGDEEEELQQWGGSIDDSVAKYTEQLPLLERRKAEAKAGVTEAERQLKEVLGRRPRDFERRDDTKWARAAIAYKEAEQALFLARAMTSWQD